jgi:hypothetical protein
MPNCFRICVLKRKISEVTQKQCVLNKQKAENAFPHEMSVGSSEQQQPLTWGGVMFRSNRNFSFLIACNWQVMLYNLGLKSNVLLHNPCESSQEGSNPPCQGYYNGMVAGCWWLMPVILDTCEDENRRTPVPGQPRQKKVCKIPSQWGQWHTPINRAIVGSINWDSSQGQPEHKARLCLQTNQSRNGWRPVQVVELLPIKPEALISEYQQKKEKKARVNLSVHAHYWTNWAWFSFCVWLHWWIGRIARQCRKIPQEFSLTLHLPC